MAMVDAKVYHKIFGTGIVEKIDEGKITVQFNGKPHMFVYPDAFEKYLTAEDSDIQKTALTALEKKIAETPVKPIPSPQLQKTSAMRKVSAAKKPTYKNMIVKCNYCDGGASDEQIGYNGVCSDAIIRYNVQKAKRPWCSNPRCDCAEYLNGKYSHEKLSQLVQGTHDVCYESSMLETWKIYTGWGSTGEKPMKLPAGVRTNSLAILSTREPNASEAERIVFAVFLVDKHDEGNESEEGQASAHPKYRIKLSLEEARQILVWNYYANRNNPTNPKWGVRLTRTLDNENAAALLADIVKVKRGTKGEALAEEFYKHFCTMNNIDAENPPEANGALRL
jgi:hypothetical protein